MIKSETSLVIRENPQNSAGLKSDVASVLMRDCKKNSTAPRKFAHKSEEILVLSSARTVASLAFINNQVRRLS